MELLENKFYLYTTTNNRLFIGRRITDKKGNKGFSCLWWPYKVGSGILFGGTHEKFVTFYRELPISGNEDIIAITRDFVKNYPELIKEIKEEFVEYFL